MEANEDVKEKNVKSSTMEARRGCRRFSKLQTTFYRPTETFYRVVMCPDSHLGGRMEGCLRDETAPDMQGN